jgi:hypothetical protein
MCCICVKITEKNSVLSVVTQAGGGGKAELTTSIQGCGSLNFISYFNLVDIVFCGCWEQKKLIDLQFGFY